MVMNLPMRFAQPLHMCTMCMDVSPSPPSLSLSLSSSFIHPLSHCSFPSTNIPDERRTISRILASPLGDLSVCVDEFGRVLLLENHTMTIRRMWKGLSRQEDDY